MKKLSIKDIVEFRSKTDRAKKNFATSLKVDKIKVNTEGGGDYWVTSLSAISNSYKSNDLQFIIEKKEELEKKYTEAEHEKPRLMYRRNIDILSRYENLDFKKWRPSGKLEFLKKHKEDFVLTIKGLQIQAIPHHVFVLQKNDVKEIGAIWFIAKLEGFRKEELGMFADILYRYLKTHFAKDYNLNSKYCIAVDVVNNLHINYSQLEKEGIPTTLSLTLDEIKNLM